jgi:hypothetical protein
VTVRQLPDGKAHAGCLEGYEAQRLRIKLPPEAKGAEFTSGTPVEVKSEGILYLGVVLGVTEGGQESVMLVAIEHAVDRVALAALQEVWRSSPRE